MVHNVTQTRSSIVSEVVNLELLQGEFYKVWYFEVI